MDGSCFKLICEALDGAKGSTFHLQLIRHFKIGKDTRSLGIFMMRVGAVAKIRAVAHSQAADMAADWAAARMAVAGWPAPLSAELNDEPWVRELAAAVHRR